MSSLLKTTAASLALAAMLGAPAAVWAQAAEPAATTEALASVDLPKALQDLNLADVELRQDRRGYMRVQGKLADGNRLFAFANGGNLQAVRVGKGQALPAGLVQQMLPEAVRANEVVKQFTTISGIFIRDGQVMVGGRDASDERLRAELSQDGTLVRFSRTEDDDPRMKRGADRKHSHSNDRGRHQGEGHKRSQGHRQSGGKAMAPLSDQAIRRVMEAGGYTDLGTISRANPRALVDAKNPQGEAVQVEIGMHGDVIREIAK